MRLLMDEPNVLLLDEPTNDLDIDTLTALEDLLDGWPGTLVVVSHDRYFVERVCDDVYALTASGGIRHLPGGIDQYMRERHEEEAPASRGSTAEGVPAQAKARAQRKQLQSSERELRRLERAIELTLERQAQLNEQMALNATDHTRLSELQLELEHITGEREALEAAWLESSEALES